MAHRIWNVPNALSISRLPLGIGLFIAIATRQWWAGVFLMSIAAVTDWADGWWARKFGPLTSIGRNLDPLTDKVLVCGAFIFLLPFAEANLSPWIVTVVIARELIVTGLRGMIESAGIQFPADWLGKLKMVLQCVTLIAILLTQALTTDSPYFLTFKFCSQFLIYLMVGVTFWSMLQYLIRGIRLIGM